MKKIKNSLATIAILIIASCKPNIQSISVTSGTANFTTYVAVGNSLCAGYSDGALYFEGQQNSYPRMLAQQFALATGVNNFKTPFMMASGNGNDANNKGKYILLFDTASNSPSPVQSTNYTSLLDSATMRPNGPYNQIGVPGARAIDALLPVYGNYNPFFSRYCKNPNTSTMIGEAMRNNPTFFSYWLGSNDVLLYAVDGGIGNVQATPNSFPLPGDLTHPDFVAGSIKDALDTLTTKGAKGVIANVPDVQSTPYFTTIPYNAVVLNTQAEVDVLNNAYSVFNNQLITAPKIVWHLGANPVVIADVTAEGFQRIATPDELICLSANSLIKGGKGSLAGPLADKYVLDATELSLIKDRTEKYNIAIKQLAIDYNLAFVDVNSFLKTFKTSLRYNAVDMSASFISGGTFSLDGVHPTPRGYALIANEFIKAINSKYGSTIPQVDVNKYRGVLLP
jgi:GDSL-like Lipase/Acylhydrolase